MPLLADRCDDQGTFFRFVQCVVDSKAANFDKAAKNAPGKQREAPSLATNSTTLVDQSKAPDLFGVALDLVDPARGSSQSQGVVVSATAYSVVAASRGLDALKPEVYEKNERLRRISFSLGSSVPDDAKKPDGVKSNVYGFKYLLAGSREVHSMKAPFEAENDFAKEINSLIAESAKDITNQKPIIDWLFVQLEKRVPAPREEADFILNQLGEKWQETFRSLTDTQREQLLQKIEVASPNMIKLRGKLRAWVTEVRNRPQLSLAFTTKRRTLDAGNDYRVGVIFDRGLASDTFVVANVDFNYKDFTKIGADTRGGRAALELRQALSGNDPITGAAPVVLSFSGEGNWMTNSKPIYVAQAKLTIPLRAGFELPMSFTYATKKDLIQEKDVRGQIGFTIDPAKIFEALRK